MILRNSLFCTFIFLLLFVLNGCAYSVESSNQDITFETLDAQSAVCYVYVNKLKYRVFPPQTVNIKKSEKDMTVKCNAPGNRTIETIVPAQFSQRAIWGGPPGMAWDYASNSLFYYPSYIAIDFSQEKIIPNPLPTHNNSDIRQPETYDLEEFLPGKPRLNSDKYKIDQPLVRRGEGMENDYNDYIEEPAQDGENKGDLHSVLQDLNPEAGEVVSDDPLSLYPGQ